MFNNGLKVSGDVVAYTSDSMHVRVESGKVYKIRLILLTKDCAMSMMNKMVASH